MKYIQLYENELVDNILRDRIELPIDGFKVTPPQLVKIRTIIFYGLKEVCHGIKFKLHMIE